MTHPNPATSPEAWNATDHVGAAMAEALVAERIHSASDTPTDVRWLGGHNPGVDVVGTLDGEAVRPDAKRAFVQRDRPQDICWMARPGNMIPEATSHIALVLLDDTTDVRLTSDPVRPGALRVQGTVAGEVYLVPREVALSATPAPRKDGTPGKGLNVGLPKSEVSRYLLPQGPARTADSKS